MQSYLRENTFDQYKRKFRSKWFTLATKHQPFCNVVERFETFSVEFIENSRSEFSDSSQNEIIAFQGLFFSSKLVRRSRKRTYLNTYRPSSTFKDRALVTESFAVSAENVGAWGIRLFPSSLFTSGHMLTRSFVCKESVPVSGCTWTTKRRSSSRLCWY